MRLTTGFVGRKAALTRLFRDSFTASAGAGEGAMVAGLVGDLFLTPPAQIRLFAAEEGGALSGAVIFTRLDYPQDTQRVWLLSPMAVAPAHQRKGIGQALLRHALAALATEGDVALTYGDPAYYGQLGFQPITEAEARAPQPLSMPHGWLGRPLGAVPMRALKGPSQTVPALDRPEIW